MIGKIKSKLDNLLLVAAALVVSSGLGALAVVLTSHLGAMPIVAGIRLNHNETLVIDDDQAE